MSVELAERPTCCNEELLLQEPECEADESVEPPVVSVDEDVVFVTPTPDWNLADGDADHPGVADVHRTLLDTGVRNVIVDMQRLKYLRARCLGAIVRLGREIARHGGIMLLCNASRQGQDLLRICRLDLHWFTCDDREEARLLLRRLVA